jgi:hypothetical protein
MYRTCAENPDTYTESYTNTKAPPDSASSPDAAIIVASDQSMKPLSSLKPR